MGLILSRNGTESREKDVWMRVRRRRGRGDVFREFPFFCMEKRMVAGRPSAASRQAGRLAAIGELP
jgi:hypothetical protein